MRRDVRTSPSFGLPSLFSQLPLSNNQQCKPSMLQIAFQAPKDISH